MNNGNFDWSRFHAYRVFDEFLECLIIDRKSYVTRHEQKLDLEEAFDEIHSFFSESFDNSKENFESKVNRQFKEASENSKIVFANVEYLWAMPVENITPRTKRSYALRWFSNDNEVNAGDCFFFKYPHIIANPGSWYLRNKYWELMAILRVLSLIIEDREVVDLGSAKKRIAEICYSAIYKDGAKSGRFAVTNVCGVHSALMNLSAPEKYESIISEDHKNRIDKVFEHVISGYPKIECREERIRLIRKLLYENYSDEGDPDRKYRWFFYQDNIKPLWFSKKKTSQQQDASIDDEVNRELAALDYSKKEGHKKITTAYRIYRSAKLAEEAKKRDKFTCQACGFYFKNKIVHVHHLDPLSERLKPEETHRGDLVTLCPNCHYMAHYWLRQSERYKKLDELLKKLQPSPSVLSVVDYE